MGGSYRPGPRAALTHTEFTCLMGDFEGRKVEMFTRYSEYRGQIRDFAILLWIVEDDKRFEVESVDCCDGELHRHRLVKSAPADRQSDRYVIQDLNRGDEPIVNSEYDVQYDWMVGNWETLVRRWVRG